MLSVPRQVQELVRAFHTRPILGWAPAALDLEEARARLFVAARAAGIDPSAALGWVYERVQEGQRTSGRPTPIEAFEEATRHLAAGMTPNADGSWSPASPPPPFVYPRLARSGPAPRNRAERRADRARARHGR
jgi:hypothetical protein